MRRLAALALLAAACLTPSVLNGQQDGMRRPFEAFRIVGPLYSVGTHDLSVFLLTSSEGHILINTGLDDSAPLIKKSIEEVGFRYEDVKILLQMQAHYDHVEALAAIKRETGAEVWATPGDTHLLESGGKTDHLLSDYPFKPVKVDRQLTDGEVIRLGDLELEVVFTPGHTDGSSSYALTVEEGGKTYDVLIANMNSVNPGTVFVGNAKYPQIAEDYASTFAKQKGLTPDIWVAAHPSQYRMHEKYSPGDAYDPGRFVDPEGYQRTVAEYEARFRELLAAEQ